MEQNALPESLRVIASLHRDNVCLDLKTVDLCFLVALQARAEQAGLTCFDEEMLLDIFDQVADTVDSQVDSPRKSASHAIQRLRDQRLLSRVDGAGILRSGEYAMTRLADMIVEFYRADQLLTRESLTLLTKTLLRQLSEVKTAAKKAQDAEAWRGNVLDPLRIVVSDMLKGIERRQRGLDAHQEEVQEQIADLLQQDWLNAIEKCEVLLEQTTATLQELNTVLLHDSNLVHALLEDIEQIAEESGPQEVPMEVQRVSEQVDRIAAWGSARQRTWSEYYEFVHRYLRDVVRLDPQRALSERLRSQLVTWKDRPFMLIAAGAPSIRILREISAPLLRPALSRPAAEREPALQQVAAENERAMLQANVNQILKAGCNSLATVLRTVLPDVPDSSKFVVTGRITRQVAEESDPLNAGERKWVDVPGKIEVEDWELRKTKRR